MVTKILESVERAAARMPKIDRFHYALFRIYTPAVVAIAAATAIIPSLVTGQWHYWIYTALTFLVISCPCALVLSVPLSFFAGIGAASKQGILFKGGIALEQMKHIGAIVFDKTGTITKGNFVVHPVVPADNRSADDVLCLCASAEQASNHPIARSVVAQACEQGLSLTEPSEMEEIAGQGLKAQVGSHSVLCGNRQLMDTRHIVLPAMDDVEYGSELYVAIDGAYAGRLVISDTIKEDAVDAVKAISSMGITTAMLTGDSQKAADYIALRRASTTSGPSCCRRIKSIRWMPCVSNTGRSSSSATASTMHLSWPVPMSALLWAVVPMQPSKRLTSSSCSPGSAPYRQHSTCPGKP